MASEYISKIIDNNDIINGNAISNGQVLTRGEIDVAGDDYNDRMLSGVAWDDMRVQASIVKVVGASNIPAYGAFLDDLQILRFNDSTMEQVFFEIQMSHSHFLGTNLSPHIHWVPIANSNAGEVVSWGLEYTWSNIGQVFGASTTIYGNTHTPSDSILLANKHYYTAFANLVKTNSTASSMLTCRLFRDATGGGLTDDYGNDAGFLEFDMHFRIDGRGSSQEYVK